MNFLRPRVTLGLVLALPVLAACATDADRGNNALGFRDGVAATSDGLTWLEAGALFGLVPLAIMLVLAALVWLPGVVRGTRYRPNRGWTAAPLWFGGPPDPAAAVESASAGDLMRGGASGSW